MKIAVFALLVCNLLSAQEIEPIREGQNILGFKVSHIPNDLLADSQGQESSWWKQHFTVKVEGAEHAMLGSYSLKNNALVFKPRFGLDQGTRYVAAFGQKKLTVEIPWLLERPKLVRSFPEKTIPANTLRMYLYFSQPMGLQNPYDFLSLLDESGRQIKDAFVEVKEGLWNEGRTRLTVFFHPGRIKRGVGPNQTQGELFKPSASYLLVADQNWKAASGRPLEKEVSISLDIQAPVREKIDPKSWEAAKLQKGIKFDTGRSLDTEMVNRKLTLLQDGKRVDGRWMINNEHLYFSATNNISSGSYVLSINPTLEDICGNSLLNVFDSPTKRVTATSEPYEIKFELK